MAKARVRPISWKLERVISGGQIGADVAGVRAAKRAGIPTGGYMPFGWVTQYGMRPEYAEEFGMVESPINGYRHRTEENVRHSDGTIRLAYRFESPGERCTMRYLLKHGKPWLDIRPESPPTPYRVALWIERHRIKVLNIAGNADLHLEPFVESYLAEVFRLLKGEQSK